jgi:hypothetical protein
VSLLAPGRNLVLVGPVVAGGPRPAATGTTVRQAVGRLVADRLARPFTDSDLLIEAEVGRPVADILASGGDRLLRTLEAAAVRRVSALRGQVIGVGPSALADPGSATHLRATGDLVALEADPGPSPGQPAAVLHTVRTAGLSAAQIADELLAWARGRPGLLTHEEIESWT